MQVDHDPKPHKVWDNNMLSLIGKWKKEGAEVTLMVDFNSNLEDNELAEFLAESGMINLMGSKHRITSPNTHINGFQAICSLFGTPRLAECIGKIGMLAFHNGITLDQCLLYCDFNVLALLMGDIHHIPQGQQRCLHTKHHKQNQQYRTSVSNAFCETNLVSQAATLEKDTHTEISDKQKEELKTLDKALGDAMLTPERKIPLHTAPW
eukprot:4385121-Ditylum_brightwellii.AAC.1